MIVTLMCANFIIGNIYVNGTPSVKVVQYHRDGGSVFPCRWITLSGIYNYCEKLAPRILTISDIDNSNAAYGLYI